MNTPPIRYSRPTTPEAAIEALTGDGAALLAGGTNLVDLMRLGVMRPTHVVDVSHLPLGDIQVDGSGLTIGAMARNSDVAHHPEVKRLFPALADALLSGASPQIRNMATVGGNLLQRTRCAYFRDIDNSACNKRNPGSGCAAMEGWTRMHAVLGTSAHCIAAHPSDMNVALAALDATVHVQGPKGPRTIPIAEFHLLPGDHPERETALQRDEIIVRITVPATALAKRSRYVKVRDRAAYAFALVSAAVGLDLDDGGTIRQASVALGGLATKPWRSAPAERALVGNKPSKEVFEAAGAAAVEGASTKPDNRFKVALGSRVVARALALANSNSSDGTKEQTKP